MKKYLVSIVTPVYNAEKYIIESFDSIYSQSFKEWEWIIINDGSSDSSFDIAKSFANKMKSPRNNIVLIDNKNNKKIPTRRNEAINVATGRYIAIHDADDISMPSRLEKQLNFLEKNNDTFCVGGHALKINLQSERIGDMTYPPETQSLIINMITKKCMNPMIDPTSMFSRDYFITSGGYTLEESIYTVPDFDLWTRALLSGKKFANIQEPLIEYRTNPDGMTQKHQKEMIHAHMVVWSRFMLNRLTNKDRTALFFKALESYHMKQIRKSQQEINV